MDTNLLREMLAGKVVVACIGNQMRRDDGVGPFISTLIKPSDSVSVVDCGETPENYLGVIIRNQPEKVIVIDAASFGGSPGEIRMVRKSDIAGGGVSTHDAILTLFADYVEKESGAETVFLAIQPETTELGEGLSPAVERAAREIAAVINGLTGGVDS